MIQSRSSRLAGVLIERDARDADGPFQFAARVGAVAEPFEDLHTVRQTCQTVDVGQ